MRRFIMTRILICLCVLLGASTQAAWSVDFPAGTIQGTVSWQGSPVSGMGITTIYASVPGITGTYLDTNGNFSFANIVTGTHTINFYGNGCTLDAYLLGTTTATVNAGETVQADIDITASAGWVVGGITVNGVPFPNPRISIAGFCGTWASDANGGFSHFLPPGTYTANVAGPSGQIGSFDFTLYAGLGTRVGTVNFTLGSIQGAVSWNGMPVSGLGTSTIYAYIPGLSGAYLDASGGFNFSNIVTGNHTIDFYGNGCVNAAYKLGTATVTVNAGETVQPVMDITASAGRVVGTITVNGVPLANPRITMAGFCGIWGSDGTGQFSHFLPPGTYTANVAGPSGQIGTFDFTVSAGLTTDLGAVNFALGNILGAVYWNGPPVSGLGISTMYAYIPSITGTYLNANGEFVFSNIITGSHTVSLYGNGCINDAYKLGETTVSLSAGATEQPFIDLTASAGRVVGTIVVNGSPLPYPRLTMPGFCGSWGSDATGHFSHFLSPGSYSADVAGPSGHLGSFNFSTLAGQTTDVDFGTTPSGDNVTVQLSGGLDTVGGLAVTFTTVSGGGNTTVVESGSGPPPPSGYSIVGLAGQPRYWDISTTATFDGLVTVCIQYDETQVRRPETSLTLMHDDGTGFVDITTSIDTQNNIICGDTTSLSPFAVMELSEPEPDPDTDGDGVTDTFDICPGTQEGQVVNSAGCSLNDLVVCSPPASEAWKNHGAYVSAFSHAAETFVEQGYISDAIKDELVAEAARSNCGK